MYDLSVRTEESHPCLPEVPLLLLQTNNFFLLPYSLFPIPYSLFPIPYSLCLLRTFGYKNTQKFDGFFSKNLLAIGQ